MYRKKSSELTFVRSTEPRATVEVSLDSLEELDIPLMSHEIVAPALASCAERHPDLVATVYTYQAGSINFHEQCWSEFLIVAGSEVVLDALYDAFSARDGVKVRYSDAIPASAGLMGYHLQGGCLWEIEEAGVWFSKSTSELADDAEELARLRKSWAKASAEAEERNAPIEVADVLRDDAGDAAVQEAGEAQALRYRRARGNASVGTIRRKIELVFGLPEGSVMLCGPDRQSLRADARISTLRRRWDYDLADE